MTAANWIELALLLCTLFGIAWQIRRDSRKDRAEQIAAAVEAARAAAQLEERVRQLERTEAGDDRPA